MELTAEQKKALNRFKASYDMYENTKKDTETRMRDALNPDGTRRYTQDDIDKEIKLISTAQENIIEQYIAAGGKEEDLKKKTRKKSTKSVDAEVAEAVRRSVSDEEEAKKSTINDVVAEVNEKFEADYIPKKSTYDPGANFDIINLPSKGEGYKDKIKKVSVSYLTAYDENIIVSPNLYRDNLALDYILEYKLMSKEIQPIDLLEGDRDAILLFLRMNGYGNEYPITATDDLTGRDFDTVIDLSELKTKDFNLKGDSNGWFSYTLPVSKSEIKFRFPTHRDTLILEKLKVAEDNKLRKAALERYASNMNSFLDADKELSSDDKINMRKAVRTIEKWADGIDDDELKFNKTITNRLNLLIMAVDGITDREYIADFIKKMKIYDSHALRKYMADNEPGIDYNITVQRPEELGGGSFTTFLQLDQFLFLNIADGVL